MMNLHSIIFSFLILSLNKFKRENKSFSTSCQAADFTKVRPIHSPFFDLLSFIAFVKIYSSFLTLDYLKLFASQEIEPCSRWVYDHSVIQSSAVEVKIKSQNLPMGT